MPKRREIRETAIQFLYCADLEGGADPSALKDTFWDFVTESDRRSLLLATFRTVHHLSQGRSSRIAEFEKRSSDASTQLAAWPEAEPLADSLKRIAKLESQWTTQLEQLSRLSKDGDDADVVQRFSAPLESLFKTDRAVAEARATYLSLLDDFPQLTNRLEPVTATIRRLQRVSDRIRMVEEPESFPEQADLSSLRESKSELRELQDSANSLIDAIIAHKEAIDEKLAAIVENYSPQRIDPVDRAILRLAAYELSTAEAPPNVILNEAIELAKRFGTSDSGRFVNGVLDRLAATYGGKSQ